MRIVPDLYIARILYNEVNIIKERTDCDLSKESLNEYKSKGENDKKRFMIYILRAYRRS